MPKKKSESNVVTKQECAIEVYKWVIYLRLLSIIGAIGTFLLLAFAYTLFIDMVIVTSIILIIIFLLYFKKALMMSKYLEEKYDIKKTRFVGRR